EEAPLRTELTQKLAALCKRLGYFGVFEVEFIQADGKALLIDFNPRFYSQMAFDIARGVPLPYFIYLAACRREEELQRAVAVANERPGSEGFVYCHRFIFEVLLRGQGLSG